MSNAEVRFNNSLRPRKPEGSLGRTAQDVHLDSHTAPELLGGRPGLSVPIVRTVSVNVKPQPKNKKKIQIRVQELVRVEVDVLGFPS